MTMNPQAMDGDGASYPLQYDVQYPEHLSRGLIFVKWLLAIPHLLILYALNAVVQIISLVAFFAILFTRKYPDGLFKFALGIRRWNANVYAYTFLLRDEYPPFSFDAGLYPVEYSLDYPTDLNRFAPLYKWILAIPHFIAIYVLLIVALMVTMVAWFAILITGQYPEGMFRFVVGVHRWTERVTMYTLFMRDEYPPFSLNP